MQWSGRSVAGCLLRCVPQRKSVVAEFFGSAAGCHVLGSVVYDLAIGFNDEDPKGRQSTSILSKLFGTQRFDRMLTSQDTRRESESWSSIRLL